MYNIGDKVWSIFDCRSRLVGCDIVKPHQKKVAQVQKTKDGNLYQVKGYHFHESWKGIYIFDNEEDAWNAYNERKGK